MELQDADPKGLLREGYAIEGISAPECRSIFLDWALSLAPGVVPAQAVGVLIAGYATGRDDHPMTAILHEALAAGFEPRRRGGRAARHPGQG